MKRTMLMILTVLCWACDPAMGEAGGQPEALSPVSSRSYAIVHTGVDRFSSDSAPIAAPAEGEPFYGQDAQYRINPPNYRDNGDGTVSDLVTGLIWQKEMGEKMTFPQAQEAASALRLGNRNDWRIPSIKELYSLILFTGQIKNAPQGMEYIPYLDSRYFNQPLGDPAAGERDIDAQTWSATVYVGRTMHNDETIFGVNFVDGRIKGYPRYEPRSGTERKMYFRFVCGNNQYGQNDFVDNGDGTVSDRATGLMWQKADDGRSRNWQEALAYAEGLVLAGHGDWRLPSAKELQSIVDYSRAPIPSGCAAIDPLFSLSEIQDPAGQRGQFPYFWTATTHQDGLNPYASAVYIAFGKAQGMMFGELLDVHGAGAQRSDPKAGRREDYPQFFGPQGDVRYVYNYVRCVRSMDD